MKWPRKINLGLLFLLVLIVGALVFHFLREAKLRRVGEELKDYANRYYRQAEAFVALSPTLSACKNKGLALEEEAVQKALDEYEKEARQALGAFYVDDEEHLKLVFANLRSYWEAEYLLPGSQMEQPRFSDISSISLRFRQRYAYCDLEMSSYEYRNIQSIFVQTEGGWKLFSALLPEINNKY